MVIKKYYELRSQFFIDSKAVASATKSIRNLDPNRYLDTSTGGSGDGFSIRNNPTPTSTPHQVMSPEKNFSRNYQLDGDNSDSNFFEKINNNCQKNRSSRKLGPAVRNQNNSKYTLFCFLSIIIISL